MWVALLAAVMSLAGLGAAAQDTTALGGLLGPLAGRIAGRASTSPLAAQPTGPGWLGLEVQNGGRYALIEAVAPNSPAALAGLQPGDTLYAVSKDPGFLAAKRTGVATQADLDGWLAGFAAGSRVLLVHGRGGFTKQTMIVLGQQPAGGAAPRSVAPAIDEPRLAYDQLCAGSAPKLSVATCSSMKRDLDQPGSEDVASAYRQFCAPGAETLSKETCAAMNADASRGQVASRASGPKALASPAGSRVAASREPRPTPAPERSDDLALAYAELCAVAEPELSAATCAALSSDATPKPAAKRPARPAAKAKR